MSWPFPVKISNTTLHVWDPNSMPCVCSTSFSSSGDDTTTRFRCPMRRRKMSSNFFARSVRLRWLRSSPTWSQFLFLKLLVEEGKYTTLVILKIDVDLLVNIYKIVAHLNLYRSN
uniref:Uncharacterized protein n=1 Tax=Cajanus cajan TaxID=3821 RepID=A0A151SJ33_CAJCA|nr:hypothetical protein KK1_001011 [Cajanus cajan]